MSDTEPPSALRGTMIWEPDPKFAIVAELRDELMAVARKIHAQALHEAEERTQKLIVRAVVLALERQLPMGSYVDATRLGEHLAARLMAEQP